MADETEQLNEETTVEVKAEETDPPSEETTDESKEIEENEIVLAGQETEKGKSAPKDNKPFIIKRFAKKNDKLQSENTALKAQLQQMASAPVVDGVEAEPDELDFDDHKDYLAAKSKHQAKLLRSVVNERLAEEQNAHRIAAVQQQKESALKTYTESAAALKVSDFNETQDKAFDVLGDDFAQLIMEEIPEEGSKLIYWFGKNPQEAVEYRERYLRNPGKTTFSLGKLAGKLTIQPKRSNAADPESKVDNASVGGSDSDWQKQLDKIDKAVTNKTISKSVNARREVKKQAKAAGFDVSTLN